jgi:hypothetical protein
MIAGIILSPYNMKGFEPVSSALKVDAMTTVPSSKGLIPKNNCYFSFKIFDTRRQSYDFEIQRQPCKNLQHHE